MPSVVIVALPRYAPPEVHCTIAYLGDVESAVVPPNLASIVQAAAWFQVPFTARVVRPNQFGPDGEDSVVEIESIHLRSLRDSFEFLSASRWGFRPHITEQPGWPLPQPGTTIEFDRLALWHGDDRYVYALGTGAPRSA
jgi:hypothetical protein